MDILDIDKTCFLVHKDYAFKSKRSGGKVFKAKVISYEKQNGVVKMCFKTVGLERNIRCGTDTYVPFMDSKSALLAI